MTEAEMYAIAINTALAADQLAQEMEAQALLLNALAGL